MSSSSEIIPSKGDVTDSIQSAVGDGLSKNVGELIIDGLTNTAIMGSSGPDLDDIQTDDITLVSISLDASASMGTVTQDVIDSFNEMLRALKKSKNAESILLSAWTFNTQTNLLFGYTPVTEVSELTSNDYYPSGATALYDTLADSVTGLVSYGQQLRDGGIRTKNIILTFSDGQDNSSGKRARDIKTMAEDLLRQETYILAYVGFGYDANGIADEVGFPTKLQDEHDPSAIRRAFDQVSQSIISTSQTSIGPGSQNAFFN